jgi:predicted HTH domain antitoxin
MQVTVDIPDNVAQRLAPAGADLAQRLLEVVIANAYRCGQITTAEVGQILQFSSRIETHAFLKQMGIYLNYDEAELQRDLDTLKAFRAE